MADIVPINKPRALAPIEPKDLDEGFRFAKMAHASGMAPNFKNAEACLMAIISGREIGLSAMQSLQRMAPINGRLSIYGDAIPALLLSHGFKIEEKPQFASNSVSEVNGYTCKITRPDGQVIERTFTRGQAKTAKLWGKSGPWQQYPERMLQMRARGLAARDGAADVLAGMYLAEEAQDIPVEGGDITDSAESQGTIRDNQQTKSDTAPTKSDMRPTFQMVVEHFRGAVDRKTLNTIVCDYAAELEQLESAGWAEHYVEAYHEAFFRLADDETQNMFEDDDVDS